MRYIVLGTHYIDCNIFHWPSRWQIVKGCILPNFYDFPTFLPSWKSTTAPQSTIGAWHGGKIITEHVINSQTSILPANIPLKFLALSKIGESSRSSDWCPVANSIWKLYRVSQSRNSGIIELYIWEVTRQRSQRLTMWLLTTSWLQKDKSY